MSENVFEIIKRLDNNGKEYWSSRDLFKVLEYTDYRNFLGVIEKAKIACENSEEIIHNHFVEANEMVVIGSGAEKSIDTIYLSRYACYLIVQNSNPAKVVVAKGQTYFAIQIRIDSKNPPCELRDENGFTLRNAEILRKSVVSARNSDKSFTNIAKEFGLL